ncbi:hypothetical protein EBR77_02425, partial [bacterium]|nr:hypothetical protein [bacterium]
MASNLHALQHFKQLGVSSLEQVLNEIALLQERIGKVEEANCIQLMTLHGAKGLEFDNVIITGLEEGILPSTGDGVAKGISVKEAVLPWNRFRRTDGLLKGTKLHAVEQFINLYSGKQPT